MSFPWSDFLALATRLRSDYLGEDVEEAALRTAISRAYYAAHKTVVQYLHDSGHGGQLKNTGKDHGIAIDELRKIGGRHIQVGRDLQELLGKRKKADYRIYQAKHRNEATHAIQKAESIIANVSHWNSTL